MMTRSSWDKEATQLNMHTRAANGGHAFSDRNAIMVAGAGRIWSPNGYASFHTAENSVVCIDEKNQNLNSPGRVLDFVDAPQATFMVGDAKYSWDWQVKTLDKPKGYYTAEDVKNGKVEVPSGWEPVKQISNDFAYTKLPFAYLNRPLFESGHWIKPSGALSPFIRQPNYPVQRAFRTAGLIRSEKPYILVVDDIQKDAEVHHYDWTLALERDIQFASVKKTSDQEMDLLLTGSDPDQTAGAPQVPVEEYLEKGASFPEGQPMLLVRVLHRGVVATTPAADPLITERPNLTNPKTYSPIRRLLVPSDSISPDFKILLFPHRQGEPLPVTTWNAAHTELTVKVGGTTDTIQFSPGSLGKTNVTVMRAGKEIAALKKDFKPVE
jgi:hypothetical protein